MNSVLSLISWLMHKGQEENLKWFVSFPKALEWHSGLQTALKSCNAQKVKTKSKDWKWSRQLEWECSWRQMRRCQSIQGALPTEMHGSDLHSMGETVTTKKASTLLSLFRKLKHISQGHLEIQNKKNSRRNKSQVCDMYYLSYPFQVTAVKIFK